MLVKERQLGRRTYSMDPIDLLQIAASDARHKLCVWKRWPAANSNVLQTVADLANLAEKAVASSHAELTFLAARIASLETRIAALEQKRQL